MRALTAAERELRHLPNWDGANGRHSIQGSGRCVVGAGWIVPSPPGPGTPACDSARTPGPSLCFPALTRAFPAVSVSAAAGMCSQLATVSSPRGERYPVHTLLHGLHFQFRHRRITATNSRPWHNICLSSKVSSR